MSTTTTSSPVSGSAPNTSSCVIQPTSDEQLNYNLAELVKMIVGAFQDGTVSPKNSDRLQNLTVDDIINLVVAKLPSTNLTSYITQNGTTIVEMIDSYNIIKDTKFVNSDFLEFRVITRRENDPEDPTGVNKIEVPYIQAKLPYDLINKDRIVQIYITTKDNDGNQNFIENEVLFEYTLDVDTTDINAPYIMETRAQKINIGKTKVVDVSTHPLNQNLWGTWGDERYIKVSYLVDSASWYSKPIPTIPNSTTPNVAKIADAAVIPMTWGGSGVTLPTQEPNESINILNKVTRIINEETGNLQATELVNTNATPNVSNPSWIIIEDPATAKQFNEYINVLMDASKMITQASKDMVWQPTGLSTGIPQELSNILVIPNNKIISQLTNLNILKEEFINFGASIGKDGLASKIIEMIGNNPIELGASSKLEQIGTITDNETEHSLLLKFAQGQQYPFLSFQRINIPSWIAGFITGSLDASQRGILYAAMLKWYPARIIEELKANMNPFRMEPLPKDQSGYGVSYYPVPTRIINFLASMRQDPNNSTIYLKDGAKVLLQDFDYSNTRKLKPDETINSDKTGAKVLIQENPEPIDDIAIFPPDIYFKVPTRVILQYLNPLKQNEKPLDMWSEEQDLLINGNPTKINYTKVFIYDPNWVINQQGFYPAKMEVHSGSITYIQDKYNMQVISSLNKEEFVPLITSEGKQQRSEYEFYAAQDQRVFDVIHNPDLVTVFRQGFKLSHGDYYSNGAKIILKSPANAGEIINIISERRYVFSNSVTKEELANAINQMKTERPILTYPASAFEKSTAEIKIENFEPTYNYIVQVKFEGKYRDDVPWVKRGNTIYLDVPEVTEVARRTLSVLVYAGTSGRLQSQPTEAIISVKNLFDNGNGAKLVIGTIPTEWYGQSNTNLTFQEAKSLNPLNNSHSTYQDLAVVGSPHLLPKRIGINQYNWYQSKLISTPEVPGFTGAYLDTAIALENIPNRALDILSSNGTETVFSCHRTQDEIEQAFEKGTLYFIVDNSIIPNANNYQVPYSGSYDNKRYSYRPAIEFTSKLNLIPRSVVDGDNEATWFLEHNNNLRGRNIHAAMILDIDFKVDYDFDGQTVITEDPSDPNNNLSTRIQKLESIKYQVQDEVPHLVLTINDPAIPNITNPYINIGSKLKIETAIEKLNTLQTENPFLVNNLYAERLFSGLHTSLIPKDNFSDTQVVYNKSKRYKKFQPFTPGALMGLFDSHYKKDFFMLNEDDVNLDPTKSIVTMARFFNDLSVTVDNPTFSARVKELIELQAIPNSFKGLFQIPSEDYGTGLSYQANIAHIQYGGESSYIDDTSTQRDLIDQKLTYQKIYISDSPDPKTLKSGTTPLSAAAVIDGFHVIAGTPKTVRIPTWWDVVLRPSVRPNRLSSLRTVWEAIRDNVPMTDQRFLKICEGILMKPNVINDSNLNGSVLKNYDVGSIPDQSQLFLFGGIGYETTKTRKKGITVTNDIISNMTADPTNPEWSWYLANLKAAYNRRGSPAYTTDANGNTIRTTGWYGITDIININYGWENGEPYIDFAWADHFTYNYNYNTYNGLKFYIDRISRKRVPNKDIYHLDLGRMDIYNPTDNDIFPSFVTKITNSDYRKIYDHPTNVGVTENITTSVTDKVNFQDITYEHSTGTWWMTIKPAFTKETHLYKFNTNYTALAGGIGVTITTFNWEEIKNLHDKYFQSPNPRDPNYSKWSLLPDITGTLRGDGPILIKHEETLPISTSSNPTQDPGLYYYDSWDNNIYKKTSNGNQTIPTTSTFFGVPEITGVRNPYIIQLDPIAGIEDKIDLVGSRIFIVVYLDKFISKLTLNEFNLFKEEILHIENNASSVNPNKEIKILSNIIPIGIRTIIPDGDDYHSTGAQILLNRISTQTGRPATQLVFRLTNLDKDVLEIENIRFQTN